jgi:hypothetical protein
MQPDPLPLYTFAICNPFVVWLFQLFVSVLLITFSSWMLRHALRGRFKVIKLFGVFVRGSDANLGAGVLAAFILLLGLLVFVSAVFRLDC